MAKSLALIARNDEGPKSPSLTDDQLIAKLRDIWSAHQRKGLEVRHSMGVLLNERLGDPADRQEYGKQVIAQVSKELGIHESEISRFRRLARDYASATVFVEQHPGCTSWTKARELLADRRRAVTGNRKVAGVLRSLHSVVKSLRSLGPIEVVKFAALQLAVQELVELVTIQPSLRLTDEAGGAHTNTATGETAT